MFYVLYMKFFLLESYECTNIKDNSLFIVQKNMNIHLDGLRLAQSKKKKEKKRQKKRRKFIRNYQSRERTYKGKQNVKGYENT